MRGQRQDYDMRGQRQDYDEWCFTANPPHNQTNQMSQTLS